MRVGQKPGAVVIWKTNALIIVPILAIVAIVFSFLMVHHSSRQVFVQSAQIRRELAPAAGESPASDATKGAGNTADPDDGSDDEASSPKQLFLRKEEYRHWEGKALAALKDGSSKDPRRMFKLIQAFSTFLPRVQHVTKMPTPSVEVFRHYIARAGVPVIFTDLYNVHPLRKWSWDMLKKKYGHLQYDDVRQGTLQNDTSSLGKRNVNRVKVKLSDFIDLVTGTKTAKNENEKGLYIAKKQLLPKSAIQNEFPYPPFYDGNMETCFTEPSSWFGMAGTITQGHIDARDNFAYQVIGTKRWYLYSPQDFKHLYFKHTKGTLEWSKALGELAVDLKKYPNVKKAHRIEVTVNEGEVLYLPRGWVHVVENVTPALMLNVWRKGPPEFLSSWSEKYRNEIADICDKKAR